MKKWELGNGHSITVEKAENIGPNYYRIQFYEDNKPLGPAEYYSKDALEWEFDIKL